MRMRRTQLWWLDSSNRVSGIPGAVQKAIHAATHPGSSLTSPTPNSIEEHDHEAHVEELLGVLEAEQTLESDGGESRR